MQIHDGAFRQLRDEMLEAKLEVETGLSRMDHIIRQMAMASHPSGTNKTFDTPQQDREGSSTTLNHGALPLWP